MGFSDDNNNNQEPKRGIPGGFILFLFLSVLALLAVQSYGTGQEGKVSFSHQVEHLVNLDLLKKDESNKIALNDNLVTFSGQFRDNLSEESKSRYRFLELLNEKHELAATKTRLGEELSELQGSVKSAAIYFLQISGVSIPKGGFSVISTKYDTKERINSLLVSSIPAYDGVTLKSLERELVQVRKNPSSGAVAELGQGTQRLLSDYRSAQLGIGTESLKERLRSSESTVSKATTLTTQEQLAAYESAIVTLSQVTKELITPKNQIALMQLRSVRNYLVELEQFNYVNQEIASNASKLGSAKASVSDVTWFYNNKELSTRALMKQDPEEFVVNAILHRSP